MSDLEGKYQKLATEYSKVRSQATVLKKALLDEQSKSTELKESLRKYEQTVRKYDQEMESLTFRNEQLTKRISVLQEDLHLNGTTHSKKGKHKPSNNVDNNITNSTNFSVLDEEFQKKILENAQLISSITDKELEVVCYKEKIKWLEERVAELEMELKDREEIHRDKIVVLQKENDFLNNRKNAGILQKLDNTHEEVELKLMRDELDKLKAECDLLRSKPTSNCQLSVYYENQLKDLLEEKSWAISETKSLIAETQCLNSRLEDLVMEKAEFELKLQKNQEEFNLTNENYQNQLDAMTEHLATQNERIANQCDEIEHLKRKLSLKK